MHLIEKKEEHIYLKEVEQVDTNNSNSSRSSGARFSRFPMPEVKTLSSLEKHNVWVG